MKLFVATVLVLAMALPAAAQGRTDYLNVESPQVHPIEVFSVAGRDFIAACNTRNNTLEIFDTDETRADRRLAVIRVGLEPVSVRYHPRLSQLYTANFLGDSISVIDVSAPGGAGTLAAVLDRTTAVGDEPLDVAFHALSDTAGTETLFVTHMALDGFDWRDARTLAVIGGVEMAPALVSVGFDSSNPPDGVPDTFVPLAAKEPRAVRVHDGKLYMLAGKGGTNSLAALDFDLDYYCNDLADGLANPLHVGNLGTAGFAMDFDAEGNLYVIGAEARNDTLADEPNVRAAPTGFLESVLYVVQAPCSASPIVRRRDVNLQIAAWSPVPLEVAHGAHSIPTGQGPRSSVFAERPQTPSGPVPVAKSQALSMLTDVVVFAVGARARKVFFTAFGNDRIGVIEPNLAVSDANKWARRAIDVSPVNGNPLAGPNGLAVKHANPGAPNDPGARLYALNHLDSSIVTIDPVAERIVAGTALSLSHDPRPAHLTQGQRFLYDAKLSGNGFVSCASCHIHGRTDGRVWDLGSPGEPEASIPSILPEGIDDTLFAADKNAMMTQSLQGLLNFEVAQGDQFWVTNAPYHWRGDRASFRDFNGAFASLLGGAELGAEEMARFEEFVNTIHYPPNPKQKKDRVPSGSFGADAILSQDGSSGAFRGLKIFHTAPTVGARSCSTGCHSGLEGSDNRLTETGLGPAGEAGNPIEVAALRGLFQKEGKRDVDGSSDPASSPYTRLEGLFHTGLAINNGALPGFPDPLAEFNLVASINAFNKLFFSVPLCGASGALCDDLKALNQFVHEFDWGIGPLVGCAQTVTRATAPHAMPAALPLTAAVACASACGDLGASLACMERQAEAANSGVSVQLVLGGQERGFWYDATTRLYREEPAGASFTRAGLVGQLQGPTDRLVFQGVPLGSERRIAAPSGAASPLPAGPSPSSLTLLGMAHNSFNDRVPELAGAWADFNNTSLAGIFLHTVRLFQWGLILEAASENGFGFGAALHHEASRRFQVSGDGIRHGAQLLVAYRNGPGGPPDPDGPLDQAPFAAITLPLHATGALAVDGRPIWQTAVEFEPLHYLALMLGGPFAPGVAAAYLDQKPFTFPMQDPALDKPAPESFDPLRWNWVYVLVLNADGTFGDGGWQRLRLAGGGGGGLQAAGMTPTHSAVETAHDPTRHGLAAPGRASIEEFRARGAAPVRRVEAPAAKRPPRARRQNPVARP